MQEQRIARRTYGSGSLIERNGAYYGQWRVAGRLVKRKLGAKRPPGTRDGLTRTQAEAALRHAMSEVSVAPAIGRITVVEAAERHIDHLRLMGRKASTVQDYGIMVRRHFGPFFGSKGIDRITTDDVTRFIAVKLGAGLARQTVINQVNFLHGVFAFAVKRGWAASNPVAAVDRPRSAGADPDIRYLDPAELAALLRAVPDDTLGAMERTLYLTAAMTGLRQGELVALRWQDVDWAAGVLRVRRSYSRGAFGTPKSRRSSRAVPMADRVGADLERQFQRSAYQGDSDLVFGHPETGNPYDASRLRKRFKTAVDRAGVRPVRFHDLRHTFGTRMAAAGAPLRSLMEWMGHRDFATTLRYADYAPDLARAAAIAERAFGAGINPGINPSESQTNSDDLNPLQHAESA